MNQLMVICLICSCSVPMYGQDFYADYVSVGGGYYTAADQSTASTVDIGYTTINGDKIIMAALHVKSITGTVLSVPNVEITGLNFSATYGYVLGENAVRPYFGAGFILGLNGVNKNDITAQRPELVVNDNLAESFGLLGLAGLHYRVSSSIAFFTDARYSFEFFSASIKDQTEEFVSIGGAYLRGGIRITINSSEEL